MGIFPSVENSKRRPCGAFRIVEPVEPGGSEVDRIIDGLVVTVEDLPDFDREYKRRLRRELWMGEGDGLPADRL